jgi:hypothetical protein
MATAAQIHANRANAQKSTGPRTAEGKAKVAQNAVQHGLLAQRTIVPNIRTGFKWGVSRVRLGGANVRNKANSRGSFECAV